jgi:hypothetical protein
MGRYYNGDIEGKFWFGVQSSDDADFFGVSGAQSYLDYFYDKDDLPEVNLGINKCLEKLGENKEKLDKFFDEHDSYNDEMLEEEGFENVSELLRWYARLLLGEKIRNCLVENGTCSFNAEL